MQPIKVYIFQINIKCKNDMWGATPDEELFDRNVLVDGDENWFFDPHHDVFTFLISTNIKPIYLGPHRHSTRPEALSTTYIMKLALLRLMYEQKLA